MLTCRVAVPFLEVVLGFPGAGSRVVLSGWRLEPGVGADPLMSAGASVPSLSLEAQPGGKALKDMTPAP